MRPQYYRLCATQRWTAVFVLEWDRSLYHPDHSVGLPLRLPCTAIHKPLKLRASVVAKQGLTFAP